MTKEDQAHINEFSQLNVKFHEIEDDLKAKQEMLVNLQDSSNEVCLAALLLLHTHAFYAHRKHLCICIYTKQVHVSHIFIKLWIWLCIERERAHSCTCVKV